MSDQSSLAIVPHRTEQQAIEAVKTMANIVFALRNDVLKKDMDYGVIPGTGDKPTLLLPGMEKLMRALNAVPDYIERSVIRDYDRPLFHYEYECRLIDADTGIAIPGGRGIGLCTSMESAFRWRQSERVCPTCGKATIIKGKAEYGGGWLCFARKGGCGAKFSAGDQSIEGQSTGRIENPDIFDQVNAIMKRAKKRALGDAIKGAANVSEFFTVDLEDFARYDNVVEGQYTELQPPPPTGSQPPPPTVSSWATTETVGNLINYCIEKLAVTREDIQRYTGITNLDNVSLWTKYVDRAAAALVIKSGVDADDEAIKNSPPATTKKDAKADASNKPYSLGELKNWALKNVYDNNTFHMNASISKLVEQGKLPPALTLEAAKNIVLSRHANEADPSQELFDNLPSVKDAPPVPEGDIPF